MRRVWLLAALLAAGCTSDERSTTLIGRAQAAEPPRPARAAASGAPGRAETAQSVLIRGVPFVQQRPDFCGEACVEMALRRPGHKLTLTQDDVFALAGVKPELGRGALAKELVRAVKKLGFDPGAVWFRISHEPRRAAEQLERQFQALHADLRAQIPSVVCTYFDDQPGSTQHFRLVVGYDARTDEVIYHEPAEKNGAHRRMARRRLLALWPLRHRPTHRILVRIPLGPRSVRAPAIPARSKARHTPADYAQHVMKLRPTFARLKGRFVVAISEPFVVVGDGGRGDVRGHADGLIRWSVGELKQRYFSRDPDPIVTIWLFKDRRSYLVNSVRLTGEPPGTPFGYYSPKHHALVMNIRTGGGTLVHEIVHPFMAANFPACPAWFNEGMGSLYEGVGRRNHRIWGYINWRLPGLQRAIRRGGLPSFGDLMAQNETRFYLHDPGTNYAQSRYLLYYLQEKGLLRTYYHRFVKNHRTDPTGLDTLKQLLAIDDMAAFQRRWEAYVLAQRYVRPAVK